MRTELVYVGIDDARLTVLLEASAALNLTVEQLIQQAVTEFLKEKRAS